jgi:hypothetical protein
MVRSIPVSGGPVRDFDVVNIDPSTAISAGDLDLTVTFQVVPGSLATETYVWSLSTPDGECSLRYRTLASIYISPYTFVLKVRGVDVLTANGGAIPTPQGWNDLDIITLRAWYKPVSLPSLLNGGSMGLRMTVNGCTSPDAIGTASGAALSAATVSFFGNASTFRADTLLLNVIGYYRADGITKNGTTASAILDTSAAGLCGTLTQATGSKQAAIGTSFNLRPTLAFTRANSQEYLGSAFTQQLAPVTAITVFLTNAQAVTQGIVLIDTSVSMFSAAGPNFDIFAGSGVATTNVTTTSASVIAAMFNGASSKVWQNASGSPITPSANPGPGTAGQIAVGSTNGANFLDGIWAETIIVAGDASADPNWRAVFLGLGNYYGIATS